VRTAMSVGQVSGLVLSAAARRNIEVVQYSPNQVKLALTGWGGADKAQVQKMVKERLKLNSIPKPADAADAAAIALCHIASSPLSAKIAQSTMGTM
jgi:crossover junction endodeoxyribonuclease RuvC